MKWSEEPPKEPGWYWEWNEGYPRVIEVFAWYGRRATDGSTTLWTKVAGVLLAVPDWYKTRWAGPVTKPE